MRLTILPVAALLMLSVPASGATLATSHPLLSIRTDSALSLSPKVDDETAVDPAAVDNPWASVATSQWNAGMNRAVDHLFRPAEHVNVYATQTGDDLRGPYEGANGANETVAAFEVVIH